jgi:beta-lactamase class A
MTSRLGNAPRVVGDPASHRGIERARVIVLGALAALGLGVALLSARQQEPRPPTFRVRTDLVQLDVSVLDRQGQPVAGLTARDFTVLKDGVPQPIVAFAVVDVPTWTEGTAAWTREIGSDVVNPSSTSPPVRTFPAVTDAAAGACAGV